jgi:hypothetical protein
MGAAAMAAAGTAGAATAAAGSAEAFMSTSNNDILNGFKALGFGVLAGFIFSPNFAAVIFFGIALYFGVAGLVLLFSAGGPTESRAQTSRAAVPSTTSAATPNSPTLADMISAVNSKRDLKCPSSGATIKPTDMKCRFCGSFLVPPADLPRPAKFGEVEIGATMRVKHPRLEKLDLRVRSRVYYGELWQERTAPDVPWSLTGNYYVGLNMEGGLFLLNWQGRYYLLDSHKPLTDADINRDFAMHARKFAASNQTAKVEFRHGSNSWRIEDIGKFRIELADGDGLQISPGAIGRFIHATHENLALVVEDYQSGGNGRDTLWQGYTIAEQDIEL